MSKDNVGHSLLPRHGDLKKRMVAAVRRGKSREVEGSRGKSSPLSPVEGICLNCQDRLRLEMVRSIPVPWRIGQPA